ncbi:MAG: hypothetical protein HRT47_04085 [Candidatus Caenarcaniphilales bacterium]|nr:hypothetical protein [Candidatus Caenarcaniphilales bacterium]
MSEEILDAEASTLNKNSGPIDHLKHLLKIGWASNSPLIQSFVEKHSLHRELKQLLNG